MRKFWMPLSTAILTAVLFIGNAYPALAVDDPNKTVLTKTGAFGSIVIHCGSEDIVVRQEGSVFRVELDADSADSYQIRDNRGIPMCERYFLYNKWDVILERTDRRETTAHYASSITITIPEGVEDLCVDTGSGSVRASGLDGLRLTVDSGSDVTVTDSNTEYVVARVGGRLELAGVKASEDLIINYKSFKDSRYLQNGAYTMVWEG